MNRRTRTVILSVTVVAVPVIATTLVLASHAVRGTDPGPAAGQLLKLVQLVLPRRRTR